MLIKDTDATRRFGDVGASLLAVLVVSVLLAAVARRYDVSAPLALVVAGLVAEPIPGFKRHRARPRAGALRAAAAAAVVGGPGEQLRRRCRRNIRPIGLLAVGLPLATTFAVGFVAYKTVPELTVAAALTLGAIVAPPDAVSATAVGRRLGLPRRIMTLLGGESLLNDATALTAYKVALAAAIGTAATWGSGLGTFALAAGGGVAVGVALGCRHRLHPVAARRSAGGERARVWSRRSSSTWSPRRSTAPGVLAVVVAALILGQQSTHAGYATRLQDTAVWKALQLVLESFAFLMIGLQLPTVVGELAGISRVGDRDLVGGGAGDGDRRADRVGVRVRLPAAAAVPSASATANPHRPPAQVFVVAWAGMRGVVSLAAAFGVPMTTLSGAPFPGRPQLVFLTFVVVIGTLLLHGLTLPWLIRRLGVQGDEARTDAIAAAAAQDKAARAAADRLDELLADAETTEVHERAADVLRALEHSAAQLGVGAARPRPRRRSARARRRRSGGCGWKCWPPNATTFIAERDSGHIDDEVLRSVLHGLDLEEATLNRT